ncbi:Desumoylating isopeptidase 2 [Tetrabaena socialis]|uniref:Desumoylating isopeptidase 2 n=1 Tax=Tetrabaena socialis TaxID=47790 RepID=A0A2J7ZNB0_9CHLO|nr:Desumoylating isopeptidase 2 [Tetrabaena socialis]|eukprot:PNH01764.1 Desumoylating isopeptidase 2 [Tetrabaena socialis]
MRPYDPTPPVCTSATVRLLAGHDYDYSGIFATNSRDAPGQVVFREAIPMGETDLSQQEIHQLVQRLGNEYKGNCYHLLQRNCNHFASDLCRQLVGRDAPTWINRLAGFVLMCHCLLPTSWGVPPPQLQTPSATPIIFKEEGSSLLGAAAQRSEGRGDRLEPSAMLPAGARV